jgi:putative heme-binding domain-containing protein
MIDKTEPPKSADRPRLVNPYDDSQELEARARSYLHVNCASCHVAAGGGNSRIQLNLELKREDMQLVGVYPQHQTFGLSAALLVAPADPQKSILYHRISRRGSGQMPPRGTHVVDRVAVQLMHDWIAQLPPQRKFVKDWAIDDVAPDIRHLGNGRDYETGVRLFKELGCVQCHRFADAGGGAGPDLSGVVQKRTPRELLESILEPSKHIAPEFAATVVVTSDGQSLQGRIGQEDDQKLILHTADALAEPVTVLKGDIDERYLSTTSTMPDGLLDTLEKPQILDLLAYLIADGKPDRPAGAE